jgi:integrase
MKQPMFRVGLLLGFFGILRTGEICKLLVKDIYLGKEPPTVVVNLGLTKAGARQGSAEIVTISNKFFVGIVQAALLGKKPGDPLFPTGSGQFRNLFHSVIQKLHLQHWGFKPYSLRRGGATDHFRKFGSLSSTVVKGRWSSAKMARIYLNDGLATLASFSFPQQQPLLDKYEDKFHRLTRKAF